MQSTDTDVVWMRLGHRWDDFWAIGSGGWIDQCVWRDESCGCKPDACKDVCLCVSVCVCVLRDQRKTFVLACHTSAYHSAV